MTHKDLEQLANQYYNARARLFSLINRHIVIHKIRTYDKFIDFLIGFDFKGNTLVYAYFEFGKGGERDCNAEVINLKDIEL